LALNLQLYGGNYLRYKALDPAMYDVLSLDSVMQYRLDARNYIFKQFKEGRISIDQAASMAEKYIAHPGDRADAIGLVENYANLVQNRVPMMGPLPYMAVWILQMMGTTFGIKAHIGMGNEGVTLIPVTLLILLTGVAFLVRWRPWGDAWLPTGLAAIALFYGIFLMYKVNYEAYLYFKDIVITVAGRYIFPVIGPIYVLSCYYLLRLFRGRNARVALAIAACLIFIGSDFPFFLSRVTPEWFDWALQ
jgi:hypothetical protein